MVDSDKTSEVKEAESNWQYTAGQDSGFSGEEVGVTGVSSSVSKIKPVEWEASEYIVHEKSSSWYIGFGAGAALLTLLVYLISNREFLPPLVILIACVSIGVYAGRKPTTKKYSIDSKGVKVGQNYHSYREFRSFSIVEEGALDSVWLTPLKRFAPTIVMYFSPEDEEKIINTLANFLPHEQKELDAIDRFTKRMKY